MPPLNGQSQRFDTWGYLYYDVMVCWGERFVRYFQRHHQSIGRYEIVGCLWSEHVRCLLEDKMANGLREKLHAHGWKPGMKIIAAFPTWYHVNSVSNPDDGMAFVHGIEQLAEELQDLFVVVKEKHARWLFAQARNVGRQDFGGEALEIYRIYDALERHPRFWLPGAGADAAELIACSDLVVSFPFTSSTLEAFGAGLKGIYFDPLGKFHGGYYDTIPGVVAHGYAELKDRVKTLLEDASGSDYHAYLHAHVKGETDPFLDGRGIERFRKLLTGSPVSA